MRPEATSVCGLKLVYEAFPYMQLRSMGGTKTINAQIRDAGLIFCPLQFLLFFSKKKEHYATRGDAFARLPLQAQTLPL